MTVQILEYLDTGRSPSGCGSVGLTLRPLQRVTVALARIAEGKVECEEVTGILEQRIDFGPGYRIYFGRDGANLVILIGGGTKHRQQADIRTAIDRWLDYKRRKEQRT